MASYLITGEGFYKDSHYDKDKKEMVNDYTYSVMEARKFKTAKSANTMLDKLGVPGFVWQPWKETHVVDKFEVVQERNFSFTEKPINPFVVERARITESDAKFLNNDGKLKSDGYFSYEEAKEEAIKRNDELIDKLKKANKKLK